MSDNPNPAPAAEPKALTMENLKSIIAETVKNSTSAEIEALKAQITDVGRKSIFGYNGNFGDGDAESFGNSVVDTSMFSKAYTPGRGNVLDQGQVLGKQLCAMGGPWKSLSPEMETFAGMLKCRMRYNALVQAGIDIKAYNEKVGANIKAALGMNETTAADGGVLVPIEFYATMIEFAIAQSPILSKVWTLPMNSNVLRIPKLAQSAGSYFGGISLHWIDEADEKLATKPTLEQLEFTAKKLIGLIYLTDELIADSMINIVNYVTGLFTRAFQYEMERVIIRGNGAAQPLGIINDPNINIVPRAAAGAVAFTDIVDLDAIIDENFRNLSWITRKATVAELRKLVDNNNQPIFHADYATFMGQPTVPPTMLGYPINLTRNCPALGNEGDVILGDLGMYILAMRQGMTIDTSEHVRFIYDETCLRFVQRVDGMPGVSIAFAILNDATS